MGEIDEIRRRVSSLPDLSQLYRVIDYDGLSANRPWHAHILVGTVLNDHTHPHYEYVILIKGRMRKLSGGMCIGPCADGVLLPGGGVYVPPNVSHGFEALEDSWVVGITVPASKSYP